MRSLTRSRWTAIVAVGLSLASTAAAVAFTVHRGPSRADAADVERDLLVVLLNRVGGPGLAHDRDYYEQLFFGGPNLSAIPEYYEVNSGGRFGFRRADLVEVQDRDDDALGTPSGRDLRSLVHGINLAGEAGFDFTAYAGGDGRVQASELTVMVIDNESEDNGATREYLGNSQRCQRPLSSDGGTQDVEVCGWRAAAGHRASFSTIAHELSHTLTPESQDVYWDTCRSQGLTLLSCTPGADQRYHQVLLDPWHRINYGWLEEIPHSTLVWPIGTRSDMTLVPGCRATRVASIIRPDTGERFIIENRRRCNGDFDVAANGVVVWYQKDEPAKTEPLYSARDTNIALESILCVFTAHDVANRAHPGSVRSGSHRLWFEDGTDAGVLLRIGDVWANGNIDISITRTDDGPDC